LELSVKPWLLVPLVKDYLSIIDRLDHWDFDQITRYRNKLFRHLIKYAFTVPLYKKKYSAAGIKPEDIKGIEDIEKLPIIHREDIVNGFPKEIIPPGTEKKFKVVNTSGSTRNPVSLFTDEYFLAKAMILLIREFRQRGLKWNKLRFTFIANFYSQTGVTRHLSASSVVLKPIFSFNNFQILNTDSDFKEMINQIDAFKPDVIVGFPGALRHLYLLKEKGFGKNIKPKCIFSSGFLSNASEKNHIRETFGARVFDIYSATESGHMAFECEEGTFHINSDLTYLEVVDKNGNVLPKEKTGRLALTRLYGTGTPVIRYTGLGDIITLKDGFCSCGLPTECIKKIHGRIKECVVLPDKRVIFPDAVLDIPSNVMAKLKTNKIHRIQLVQNALNQIEVLVIIDPEKKDASPSVETLFNELKNEYQKLFGSDVEIDVKEVTKLRYEHDEVNPSWFLSKIDINKYF
jgi:phenylacetate-CoA ligase